MLGEGYRFLVAYVTLCSLIKYTDVSDERTVCIFRVLLYLEDEVRSYEMSLNFFQTTRFLVREHGSHHNSVR